jgi:hypothetical protein
MVLLAIPAVALVGCFEFDEPACSFKCGAGGGADSCPDDYECRSDGYCHRHDSTDVCPFSDAAVGDDLSAQADMSNLIDALPPTDAGDGGD